MQTRLKQILAFVITALVLLALFPVCSEHGKP